MRMLAYMKTESVQTLVLFHYDTHDPIDHYAGHACRQEHKCVWSCLVCHSIRRARDTARGRGKRQKQKTRRHTKRAWPQSKTATTQRAACSVQDVQDVQDVQMEIHPRPIERCRALLTLVMSGEGGHAEASFGLAGADEQSGRSQGPDR